MDDSTEVTALEYQIKPTDTIYYLHIPKTAGNTLTNILDANFDYQHVFHAHSPEKLMSLSPVELAQFRFLRVHFPYTLVDNLLHSPLVRLTLLRDPVVRTMSH